MTCIANSKEVLFRIVAGVAAKLFVMDFQVCHCAAQLTSPAIATQHLLAQIFVQSRIQPHAHTLGVH